MSERQARAQGRMSTREVVVLAMFTAVAYVVMLLSKMLPSMIGFLQFDLKDTIVCIGGFLFGPMAAAAVSIVVCLIEMFTASDTAFIGAVMNAISTCAFCCTATFIYKKDRTMRGAVVGLASGTVVLTAVMLLWNYLITPLYMQGVTREQVAGMLIPVFLPFNLTKGGLNMAATLLLYKPVVTALRAAKLVPTSDSPKKGGFHGGMMLLGAFLLATFIVLMLVLTGKI